jgi:cell division initiation protein
MALTPVELRHVAFRKRPLGYARHDVDRALEEAVAGYEAVWRERADLADKVEHLEGELERHRDLESLLRTTLVSAERNAEELKAQAQREADVILEKAHAVARSITQEARAERERLVREANRVRTLLGAALDAVAEAPSLEAVAPGADDPEVDGARQREAA